VKHTEEYNWRYIRTNSKGVKIFRHDTYEELLDVLNYLDERGYDYIEAGGGMLWITGIDDEEYSYYWTTGKWSSKKSNRKKHFQAKGIKDFLDSYIGNKNFLAERKRRYKEAIKANKG